MPFVRRHSTGMFLSTNSQHFTVGQTAGEKKTKQFHIQQCLLRYPRSQSKRSILVLPLQTKMDIQESFAKTMICTQANTGAHHMVCGSTQAKKTVYTRLCFSPFFCQTWRRLFGTLLAPSFCNASAIDYILSQMPVCNPQVQNHKPNTKSASLVFLGPFPFPCCCFCVPPPCHSFGKLMFYLHLRTTHEKWNPTQLKNKIISALKYVTRVGHVLRHEHVC